VLAFYTCDVATQKKKGGRVTPKGGNKPEHHFGHHDPSVNASSRYTPPVPVYEKHSAPWVPVLMFILLGLGALVILFYYLGFVPGGRSNWYLAAGLGSLLGGLYTATKYH
jgi:hypothetical protein